MFNVVITQLADTAKKKKKKSSWEADARGLTDLAQQLLKKVGKCWMRNGLFHIITKSISAAIYSAVQPFVHQCSQQFCHGTCFLSDAI